MNNNNGLAGLSNTLLLITFLVLKLCNVIDWSWWWVLSPLWIPVVVAILICILLYIYRRKIKTTDQIKIESDYDKVINVFAKNKESEGEK